LFLCLSTHSVINPSSLITSPHLTSPHPNLTLPQQKIIDTAERVYQQEPLFQQIESSSRIAIENGNSNLPSDAHNLCWNTYDFIRRNRDLVSEHAPNIKTMGLKPYKKYMKVMWGLVKKNSAANCGEINTRFQQMLYQAGLDTVLVWVQIGNKQKFQICSDHVFLLTSLADDADPRKPSTWGEHATYLCAWAKNGLCLPAKQGIQVLEKTFNLDKKAGEYFDFSSVDFYNQTFEYAKFKNLLPKFKG
jgi:hypothetical protein